MKFNLKYAVYGLLIFWAIISVLFSFGFALVFALKTFGPEGIVMFFIGLLSLYVFLFQGFFWTKPRKFRK